MYKLIVLSAVLAVAAGVAIGPAVITLGGVSNLAVAPSTVLASPAGAVNAAVTNQVLGGVTGLTTAGGVTGINVVNPIGATIVTDGLGLIGGVGLVGLGGLGWR